MPIDSRDRSRTLPHPAHQALIALLVTAALVTPAWSWSVAVVGHHDRALVATVTGVFGAALCVALTVAAHRAATLRAVRDGRVRADEIAESLEREAARVTDHLLPTLVEGVRAGRTVQETLAAHPPIRNAVLDRLLRTTGAELDLAARRAAHARALIARCERRIIDLDRVWLSLLVTRVREDRCTAVEHTDREHPHVPTGHPSLDDALASLADHVRDELLAAARRTDTALAATAACGARLRAGLETTDARLRVLRETHGDRPEIREDLVEAGRVVARTGRIADTLVTLAGGGPGRRHPRPIALVDALRSAGRRIGAHRRVRAPHTGGVAVLGHAAEALIRVLTELLDNATVFSGPDTDVHVRVEEGENGISVMVEDAGPGMNRRERDAARDLVTSPRGLEGLEGDRTGLAVVGLLASRHRFDVTFRTSPYGGLGAAVLIPRHLVTAVRPVPSVIVAEEGVGRVAGRAL
ncbi:ATP-binding protein [Nocardiopsis lambiniae]|uniref:histidine kinase n=1 Tax=Nocardiopsis lambiniae TaxID=3075539 RepID=A0ABU2M8Z8_9ACTN|nr:ATP-binding protein [Nocardiopsis sp. DSM 44743]MDT0328640.1 ATP-binding protein [Nocardiopsis sp. DSM 44743]